MIDSAAPPSESPRELHRAPPLAISFAFFFMAPIALWIAAALLLWRGPLTLTSTNAPLNIAAVHLATLGFVGSVMFGALYQMIPVVAGVPVPMVRLAHGVHAGFLLGLSALLWAQATGSQTGFWLAFSLLTASLSAFFVPVAVAMAKAPARSDTVRGMRLALVGLAGVASLGLYMVFARAGSGYTETWVAWRTTHISFGIVAWIGGLLTAISYQIIPMFYVTSDFPPWVRKLILAGISITLVVPVMLLATGASPSWISLAALPGATAIWLVHPATAAWALFKRRRRRREPSLSFWWLGLGCAPAALLFGVVALSSEHPIWPLLFGWLALWGWAGSIVHGMLMRILPFLVWFHRFAPLAGYAPIPSMRQLLPERRGYLAWTTHAGTLLVGCAAIISSDPWMARAMGAALCVTGALLGANLVHVLRRFPDQAGVDAAQAASRAFASSLSKEPT